MRSDKIKPDRWNWDDETRFMRTLGPDRLARYVQFSLALRQRDFEGYPAGEGWWKRFIDAANAAGEPFNGLAEVSP